MNGRPGLAIFRPRCRPWLFINILSLIPFVFQSYIQYVCVYAWLDFALFCVLPQKEIGRSLTCTKIMVYISTLYRDIYKFLLRKGVLIPSSFICFPLKWNKNFQVKFVMSPYKHKQYYPLQNIFSIVCSSFKIIIASVKIVIHWATSLVTLILYINIMKNETVYPEPLFLSV